MNILMLLFKDIHLDARVQREAIALVEAGHRVDIACLYEREEEPSDIHPNVTYIRLPLSTKRVKRAIQSGSSNKKNNVVRLFRTPILKLMKDVYAQNEYRQKVMQLMKLNQYDAVHCHDLNTLPVGVSIRKKYSSIKLIYDSHELFNEMVGKNKVEKWVGYQLEERLIKKVDRLITVNPYAERFFLERYGSMPSTIIQNTPIWHEQETEKNSQNYWRDRYNISYEDKILIYQGGLTPQRGLEECIESLLYLPDRFKFVLLGEGRLRPQLEEMVVELGLKERVFFHDPVSPTDILKLTSQADIGLVMYKNTCLNNYLSTPNKIFEYFLSGIPTVASDHPGKSYIVRELGTGVCVEESADKVSQGILLVEQNYTLYKNNCITKRSRYTWDVEKKKLITLYNEVRR